jgi:hypothetical protein
VIRWLRALRVFLRNHSYVPAPEWTQGDGANLASFLGSHTGAKLKAYLLQSSIIQNQSAVSAGSDLNYRCGYASGYSGCIAAIEAFAAKPNFETETSDSIPDLDHLSP